MDSQAIAALTALAAGIKTENGETLETIQAERTEQEAARKALLQELRPRLEAAIRTTQWAEDQMAERDAKGRESERAKNYRLEAAADSWHDLVAKFEASPDPKAFVIRLEEEADEARQELDEMQECQQHQPRRSRRY